MPLDMVWIEPGVFTMGSPLDEPGRNDDEGSQLEVRLTRGFYLSQCEITQHQWVAVTRGAGPWRSATLVRWQRIPTARRRTSLGKTCKNS